MPGLRREGGKAVSQSEGIVGDLADLLGEEVIDETVEWHHRPTEAVDPETGQGFAHVQYAFAAHRAVVDGDTKSAAIAAASIVAKVTRDR